MESLDKLVKGNNKKYLYIFGGVIITAIVLWYLFKDAADTVVSKAEVDVNASDYDPASLKSAAFAKYKAGLATATSETEKAALKKEYDAEIANIEKTALLQSQYYELFGSYPKSNMTADMIQEAIDIENQSLFDTAASKYKAETNSNPPASCKTASAIYAALDSWKANQKVVQQNKVETDNWNSEKVRLDGIVQQLCERTMFNYAKWNYKAGGVMEPVNKAMQEKANVRNFIYITRQFVNNATPENNKKAKMYPANGIQKLYCIANDLIGGSNNHTKMQSLVRDLYNSMDKIYKDGYNVNGQGKVIDKAGKVITDYSGIVFFSGSR